MTQTRIDIELPFKSPNGEALRSSLAATFGVVSQSDIGLRYGKGHPDAFSNGHVVGLIFKVDPADVSQSNVDTVVSEISSTLGCNARELGWGSHEPDYLDQ